MLTFFCMPAIHSSVVIPKTKVHLVYVLLFVALGHKEACMPQWRFGLEPELLGVEYLHFQTPHSLINQSLKVHFE
jgi:hypothetical protein